jgi:uncharacterized membrane protein YgdD (TMEM256/DUF423 family)
VTARFAAAFGALACGASVALAAVARHAAGAQDGERLALAAAFAFAHGLALVAVATRVSRPATIARLAFALGIVLFSGSLVAAAWLGWPTVAAPAGGLLLMAGWAILAFDFLRRPPT